MARSALYCERRSHAIGSDQDHLFSERKVIVNRRTKTRVILTVCCYCGRKLKNG